MSAALSNSVKRKGIGGTGFLVEITISGDAKVSLDCNSDPMAGMSKHSLKHEMGVDFTGSGTTDGGLSFGGKAGFDTGDDTLNEGTVFISGAFGTITIGDNDSADLLAGGIADVGLNGIGVDDVAEGIRGKTADQFRFDATFGQISIAVSAGTSEGTPEVKAVEGLCVAQHRDLNNVGTYGSPIEGQVSTLTPVLLNAEEVDGVANPVGGVFEGNVHAGNTLRAAVEAIPAVPSDEQFAFGMKFDTDGVSLGVGYDSEKVLSAGVGYARGAVSTNLFYSTDEMTKEAAAIPGWGYPAATSPTGKATKFDVQAETHGEKRSTIGLDLSYRIGASTLTLAFGRMKLSNVLPYGTPAVDHEGEPSIMFVGQDADGNPTGVLLSSFNTPTNPPGRLIGGGGSVFDGTADGDGDTRAARKFRSGTLKSYGIGLSNDLGGGATLTAGFGAVPMYPNGKGLVDPETKLGTTGIDTGTKNMASNGLSFTF